MPRPPAASPAEITRGRRHAPPAIPATSRSAASVDALFRAVTAAHPRLDILVNNAGIAHVGTIEQTTPEDLDRVYRVNVVGVYLCARAAVPIMLRQGGGVILNMALDRLARRHPRSLRLLDDQGGGADDDALDRRRLHEARHPLQLHLPRARSTRRSSTATSRRTIRAVKPR